VARRPDGRRGSKPSPRNGKAEVRTTAMLESVHGGGQGARDQPSRNPRHAPRAPRLQQGERRKARGRGQRRRPSYGLLVADLRPLQRPGCLLHNKFYSPAFALLRPIMEALVRACVVLVGTPEEVARIRQDEFG